MVHKHNLSSVKHQAQVIEAPILTWNPSITMSEVWDEKDFLWWPQKTIQVMGHVVLVKSASHLKRGNQ